MNNVYRNRGLIIIKQYINNPDKFECTKCKVNWTSIDQPNTKIKKGTSVNYYYYYYIWTINAQEVALELVRVCSNVDTRYIVVIKFYLIMKNDIVVIMSVVCVWVLFFIYFFSKNMIYHCKRNSWNIICYDEIIIIYPERSKIIRHVCWIKLVRLIKYKIH